MNVTLEIALVKLGGSVVSDKGKLKTFSRKNVVSLSAEINSYLSESSDRRVVIVHGGGSFGHVKAKAYSIREGLKNDSQLKGFAEVRQDMRLLNSRIMGCLMNRGIASVSLPAESIVSIRDTAVQSEDFSLVDASIAHGMAPVTFGDAVFDSKRVFTIISGDILMHSLAGHLRPQVSVFCTDVDGVYDSNPVINRSARLIRLLTESTKVSLEESARSDVTGEMRGKLAVLFDIARCSSRTYVVNGRVKGRLLSALRRDVRRGTEVSHG